MTNLFMAVMYSTDENFDKAKADLINKYGTIKAESKSYSFDFTHYYDKEMGEHKLRKFVAYLPLECPTKLREIKLATNDMEDVLAEKLALSVPRPVNLDPGYIDEPRVVLASCKDYNHRIAIGRGVYADLHLIYSRKEGYVGMDWSYMDYTDDTAREFFMKCRQILRSERLKVL